MNERTRSVVKLAAAVVLVAGTAGFLVATLKGARGNGTAQNQVWFYDQSEKRLYSLSGDVIPPDKGVGGDSGDGVRAVVVAFERDEGDPAKRRIAYLETCTAELKSALERFRSSRAERKKYDGPSMDRNSDSVRSDTLVKRLQDESWVPMDSAEGRRIMNEWRSWRGPSGQAPVVCSP